MTPDDPDEDNIKNLIKERSDITKLKVTLNNAISDTRQKLAESIEINDLLVGIKDILLNQRSIDMYHQDIKTKHKEIKEFFDNSQKAHDIIITDTEDYKIQKENVKNLQDKLLKFEHKFMGDENGEYNKSEPNQPPVMLPAIKKELSVSQDEINSLAEQAQSVLHKATDKGLHSVFEEYRSRYTKSSRNYNLWQYALLAFIFIFGLLSITGYPPFLINFGISLPLLTLKADLDTLVQLSFRGVMILPLVYLSIILNRNANIQKALAEEYAHKASLTKSIAGYRELYDLEHKNDEYTNLFKSIVEGLNANPANKIFYMLNKKTPQENDIQSGL